ncbi:MAG: hypothetical protein JST32_06325 [Bacteroidetes bacterium]|nr:hypothetical protein [Bacteroidota bacterium]
MKKTLTTMIAACVCLIFSCSEPRPDADLKRRADSIDIQRKAAQIAKRMMKQAQDNAAQAGSRKDSIETPKHLAAKTVRVSGPCPVKVSACLVVSDEHGKGIVVTLKNTSHKKIAMVDVAWVVYNKQNERLGSSGGKAKKTLPAGRTASYAWGINAEHGTHAKASVRSIRYNDGSVWTAEM